MVSFEELHQVLGADFLLALDQHLDVDGERPLGLQIRRDRGEWRADGPLVVGGAGGKRPAVTPSEVPRVALPLLVVIDWLDVVMCVEEDGRLPGRLKPFAVCVWQRPADTK